MYFDNLEAFEDWKAHLNVLENKLGHLSEKVIRAVEIVKRYHDQPRMFIEGNYNRHPLRVARILVEELEIMHEQSILIALCHDLGEWSEYNINDLKEEFGDSVYEGVKTLTWDQSGEWSSFVNTIVTSNIKNLVAIKIADKLDNNRAAALSDNIEEKEKARTKTVSTIMPLVEKYYPNMKKAYNDSLSRLV